MGTVFVDNLEPQSGTSLTLGASGDTVKVASGVTNNVGIGMADQWRLTSDVTSDGDITSNLERVDTTGFGQLGTGMTESSGIFTFPSTGIYFVMVNAGFRGNSENSMDLALRVTTDNSSYNTIALARDGQRNGTDTNAAASCSTLIDVTDTSNVKVKFQSNSIASGSKIVGNTDQNITSFLFVRLGDT
tara:strand:+ start:995 stop:1558 length:564 start_codon:yes stop_codon:yes gene_type:complete